MKNHLYPFFLILSGFFLMGCQGSGEHQGTDQLSTVGQDSILIQMEKDWSQAVISRDISMLENILSEDLVYHTEEGEVLNRKEYIDNFILNKRNILSVAVDNMKVFFYEGYVAVVTGNSKEIGMNEDSTMVEYSGLWTNVWLREDGSWQCIAGHGNTEVVK
jgi:ketosteroid isomerase-like protein